MRKSYVLCPARHSHPDIDGLPAIFPEVIEDPTDVSALYDQAKSVLDDSLTEIREDGIRLYVTGMTVAVGAVIEYCFYLAIPLLLEHYDRETETYYPQCIISRGAADEMKELGWI